MNTKEIDILGNALRASTNGVTARTIPQPTVVPADIADRVGSTIGRRPPTEKLPVDSAVRETVLRNRSFPDLFSLGHALQFAKDAGHGEDVMRLEALKERSEALGASGYGTHLPVLAAVMAKVDALRSQEDYCTFYGPVLECGAGFYSTILLNTMCRASGRKLYTLESDPAWLAKVAYLASETHVLRHVEGWAGDPWGKAIDSFGVDRWSVVFVDHREKIDRIAALRDRADFIVVHDTRNTFHAGLDMLLDTFRYRYDFTELSPCTTVVSMTEEFSL